MAKSHYETLGLTRTATPDDVRTAFRRIAIRHHPDRTKDPASHELFKQASVAYEVLSDPSKRRDYDLQFAEAVRREAQANFRTTGPASSPRSQPRSEQTWAPRAEPRSRPSGVTNVAAEVSRLSVLFSRGRFSEAETLANEILRADGRQAVPYAVLGDIARMRGRMMEAQKMYAYAAQMDPRNPVYQRRYEEALTAITPDPAKPTPRDGAPALGVMFATVIVLFATLYVGMSQEAALLPSVPLISTWTLGLVGMLLLSGVTVGAALSLGNLVDRLSSTTTNALGRVSPTVTLGVVAIASFWASVLIYAMVGLVRRATHFSTTRMIIAVVMTTLAMASGAAISRVIDPVQVLIWGGNLVYIGALCGWMVADAFRS